MATLTEQDKTTTDQDRTAWEDAFREFLTLSTRRATPPSDGDRGTVRRVRPSPRH